MNNELKQQIEANEKNGNRWKSERLAKIINQSITLPVLAANDFYKIVDQFTEGWTLDALRDKIDAQMPELWKLMPPPSNDAQWTEYFNDLIDDCAVDGCMRVKEVWQIIGYDAAEFERMRNNGFTFLAAFDELHMNETDEQMEKRGDDLTLEQYKERIEHYVNQARESAKETARINNEAFKKFGINLKPPKQQDEH